MYISDFDVVSSIASNLLFVESPAGVGWSYSNTTSDYNSGDASTGKDSCLGLFSFLSYSLFKLCCFYFFKTYQNCVLTLLGKWEWFYIFIYKISHFRTVTMCPIILALDWKQLLDFWQPMICICSCWNGTRSFHHTDQGSCSLLEKAMQVQ